MGLLSKNVLPDRGKEHKILYAVLSFVIPFIIVLLAFAALGISPFGNHSVAISDGRGYVYGLSQYKRLLTGEESWLYNLRSLGANQWSNLSWGGIVPAKALAVFGTLETFPDWLGWITIVNLSLCGVAMYFLLSYLKGHKLSNLIFSTSYALIGFSVVNCYQMLFFIGPQMLPLMALGLIRMMRGKSPVFYMISLGLCIFFNFYFGFHLCVASFIFLIAYLYAAGDTVKGKRKKLFFTWLGSSVVAGLLSSFFWLPAIKAFTGGGRIDQTGISEYTFSENMPFIRIFSKLFSGANSTSEMVNGLPNIFCGILVVALVILFFMNKKIDSKRKRAASVVLGFYLLTFCSTALTLLMHGGTHTNWFPYRYSYVFSFILIALAAEEFGHLDDVTVKDTKKCGAILLISAILVFGTSYEFITGGAVVLDLLLLFVMWIGFYMYKTKPEKAPKRVLSMLLLLLVSINLYANFAISIRNVREWELDVKEYQENVLKYGALIDAVRESDTDFYRMEKDDSDLGSLAADPFFYDYYGVSGSGPAIRAFINKELCKIGVNWFDMRHWYSEGIPAATDALLGLRYLISERDLAEEKGYEKRVDLNGVTLYRSNDALPVSILSDKEAAGLTLGENIFENLNMIWRAMTGGDKDIFTEQKDVKFTLKNSTEEQSVTSGELRDSTSASEAGEKSEYKDNSYIEYRFTAEKDGPIYLFDTSIPGSVQGLAVPALKYVGYYHKGDEVRGEFDLSGGSGTAELLRNYCVNIVFAYSDGDVLSEYAALLNDRDIDINVDKDDHLYGSFTAEEGQVILFTIPWDEGWTCCIDGQKVEIDKTWDLFMSVEVPAGEHTWEMKFFPAWMKCGLIISGAALVALIVWGVAFEVAKKKKKETALDAAVAVEESPEAGEKEASEPEESPEAENDAEAPAPEQSAPERTENPETEERS